VKGFFREDNSALQRLKELHHTAISYADKMMLTDAPLLYTPGQLALAALHKSNDILKVFNFERYLETIFSRQNSDCTVEQFVQSINAIHYLVKVFAWFGVIQFTYKSVVQVLFSIIQPTAKKSTYAMLHYISLHFMLHRITRELHS